jgi:O-antigen/teichoic acid export membrane protein
MNDQALSSDQVMQESLSRVAKGGALIIAGMILSKLFGFLRQFAVIRLLSPEDYGFFALGMTVIGVYILISTLGLQSGSQRYIAYYQGKGDVERTRGVISSTLKITAITASLMTILAILLAKPLSSLFQKPEMSGVLLWLVPLVSLTMGIEIASSIYMGFQKVGVRVFSRDVGLYFMSLVFVVIFLLVHRTLDSLLAAMVVAHVVVALLTAVYSLRRFPIKVRGGRREEMTKELILFSLPLFAVSAFNYLMLRMDILMLGYFESAEMVGVYNAVFILVQVLAVFLLSVGSIYMPVASSMVARDYHDEIRMLYRSATKWLFVFTLPLFLILFLFPSHILGLAYGSIYPTGAGALQLLCLGEFVHTFLGPNGLTILAYGRPRMLLIHASIATVVNVVLNILFIPRWGITGAAIASFIALILINLLNSGYLYLRFKIHPFTWGYIKPVVLLTITSAALFYPLDKLLDVSRWLVIAYYPLFLGLAILYLFISRSLDTYDKLFLRALKDRLARSFRR